MKKQIVIGLIVMSVGWSLAEALQVTPTYQVFTVKGGEKIKSSCTLTNNDGEDLEIQITSKDWFLLEENKKFSAPGWLIPTEKTLILKNGETKTVEFTVNPPKKAKGELIGMLSFSMQGENFSSINKIFSVAVYCGIKGTEKMKGELTAISVVPSTDTRVGVMITNNGNVHIRPVGFFEIKDQNSVTIGNVIIPKGTPVYPGKTETYAGVIRKFRLPPGEYLAHINMTDADRQVSIFNAKRKFLVGPDEKVELK